MTTTATELTHGAMDQVHAVDESINRLYRFRDDLVATIDADRMGAQTHPTLKVERRNDSDVETELLYYLLSQVLPLSELEQLEAKWAAVHPRPLQDYHAGRRIQRGTRIRVKERVKP